MDVGILPPVERTRDDFIDGAAEFQADFGGAAGVD
jgi:hypothetical protein